MDSILSRLALVRELMEQDGVTHYLVDTADPHLSEYINDYYKEREYLSGFTGSNGTLLIMKNEAYLWTDGRYFVQAKDELNGSGIELMRMGLAGVPTITDFLKDNFKDGDVLGFNGFLISARMGKKLKGICKVIRSDVDYCKRIWLDRPLDSASKAYILSDDVCGENAKNKLQRLRKAIEKEKVSQILITKLDDIMWLFNIRGNDIECNPVCYSYSYISLNRTVFYIKRDALTDELHKYMQELGVEIKDYGEIAKVSSIFDDGSIMLDEASVNFAVYEQTCKNHVVVDKSSPTELMKAVKNNVEIARSKECYLNDSVVLTRFIKYIKEHVVKEEISEVRAAAILDEMRSKIPGFIELSFPTISAYGANAAMMHYEAKEDDCAVLKPEGIYLVDSGATYINGTTDVTRSIILGPCTNDMKLHFTKALAGMLRLMNASFMYGCVGTNLDILARGPLWEIGIDYKCGTGHGVGYILGVHEGPQSIRTKKRPGEDEPKFEAGMIVSDEPGVYIEGSHGIRHENILLCVSDITNQDGTFMHFEPLTLVPIDLDGVDVSQLTSQDIMYLNKYHELVFEKLSPFMDDEELLWLKNATRSI